MGYNEVCCQFCAVSFNIARLRTKYEPEEAGWGYSSGLYYSGDEASSRCSVFEKSGCENIELEEDERGYGPGELHLPGPGCTFDGGYSGHRIGVEEMKGMRLPRYIVAKPEDFDGEEEEADFEKDCAYFLTSQTTIPPDDFEPGTLEHIRYGIEDFFPQNFDVTGDPEAGVPVHDACWKIFERISTSKLGKVDLQGLVDLWSKQACGHCGFQNLKQDPVILKCRNQFWSHIPGTEYLVANPYDIPGFTLMIQEAMVDYPSGDGVFYDRRTSSNKVSAKHGNRTDIFSKFPAEIRNMILSSLSSKDIVALRLVSRSFRQLPKQLFKRLIREDMPWFWEIDVVIEEDEEYWQNLHDDRNIEKEMETQDVRADKEDVKKAAMKKSRDINWLDVYRQLRVLQKGNLGVRNRVRVWAVVEEVVRRIARMRKGSHNQRRYELRRGASGDEAREGDSEGQQNDEEQTNILSKNDLYCSRCRIF